MHRQFCSDRMNGENNSNCVHIYIPVPELCVAENFSYHQRNRYSKGATKCLDCNSQRPQGLISLDESNSPVLPNTLRIQNSSCETGCFHCRQKKTFPLEKACFACFLHAHVNPAVLTATQDSATAFNPRRGIDLDY